MQIFSSTSNLDSSPIFCPKDGRHGGLCNLGEKEPPGSQEAVSVRRTIRGGALDQRSSKELAFFQHGKCLKSHRSTPVKGGYFENSLS
jgi:hypothetical protein